MPKTYRKGSAFDKPGPSWQYKQDMRQAGAIKSRPLNHWHATLLRRSGLVPLLHMWIERIEVNPRPP